MKIALAQLNFIVGDLAGNTQKIRTAALNAKAIGAQLLVTSELAVCGYPPRDLLLRGGFVEACLDAVRDLARESTDDFAILVGHPAHSPRHSELTVNAASLLVGGQVADTIYKSLLPNYDVFDEKRYFSSGEQVRCLEFGGLKLGAHICEDAWWGEPETNHHFFPAIHRNPIAELAAQGADVFINMSASPFESGKALRRIELMRKHVAAFQKPFLFVNQVGGNDDLVFDGNTFALNADGTLLIEPIGFQGDVQLIDLIDHPPLYSRLNIRREAELYDALVLGLSDYMQKSGFTDCVLGLSGGIDSALVACLAVDAVGPNHVHAVMMPSRYSSDHSVNDSIQLAQALRIDAQLVPIDEVHKSYESLGVVGEDLRSQVGGLAEQNLQARIRGAIVMTRSNRHNWIALATGNKSEIAMGYCTLYGDMCGGYAALSDVYKRDVYSLSRYVNEKSRKEIIPNSILEKAPSAELAPNQFDQDTLPPYDVLDEILFALIEEHASPANLSEKYPPQTVQWVVQRLDRNEFKRRQMAPGAKLSASAFGTGRRMPMAAKGFSDIKLNR